MDLTSVKTINHIKEKFDFSFKKGLGQNFLTDCGVLEKAVEAAEIENGVLEIGPGFGVLTNQLALTGKKVVSVEIDQRLIPVLSYTLSEFDNVRIINQDIMKMDVVKLIEDEFGGEKISIAANLPYYITTPIITTLLEKRLPVTNMVFMVQKEVAQRIVAKKGRDSGAISLFCQYFGKPEMICTVPKNCFYPAPKVDSALLKISIYEKPPVDVKDEKLFFKVIRASFCQRRKTLANALSSGFGIPKEDIENILISLGYTKMLRGETLDLKGFADIANQIYDQSKGEKDNE